MFPSLNYADVALWAVAGYAAASTLVRLALCERQRAIRRLRRRATDERRRHADAVRDRRRNEAARRARWRRGSAA